MKKSILVLSSLFFVLTFFGQTDKQLDKIADRTCECLSKKKIKKESREQLELELGLCMMESIHALDVNISLTNEKKMVKLGEQVGLRLAVQCKPFMQLIGGMMEDDPESMMELIDEKDEFLVDELAIAEGELISIDENQFTTIKVKETGGKTLTFYWFEYFEGANLLKDDPNSMINKGLKVEYEEKEVFLPKYQEYIKIKVIKSLAKQ